jgi:hypothetical protein
MGLYDVKNDPGCRDDLHKEKKDLVSHLSQKYEKWWNSTYPLMMQAGGDLGNPDQGKRASRRDKDWKKKQETQAK